MDVKMPGMVGFTATRLIKEKRPRLPVVAQTAFAMISDRETALANGCDDYIAKPIDQELLLKILSRFIP
jgi:CheY-like chemotaxis protein